LAKWVEPHELEALHQRVAEAGENEGRRR